jgi:hypothetical protein
MASLTTVYVISLILASMSAMGSTFLGSKFTAPKTVESVEIPQSTEQTEPPISEEVSPLEPE